MQRGWLYAAPYRPAAELDGAGAVVSVFVYATRDNVPDYMIRGGDTYRLVTDGSGSVRLVVRTDTGEIAERIDYDTFGNVVADSQPGFQPFGFGGGLHDADTGLVQFGLRDYDPETGRFTARDPFLFAGGQANLYVYSSGDPVNFRDPSGGITCLNFVGGMQQLIGGVGDVIGGVGMIGAAIAEAGSGVAAPLAPITGALGVVTFVQGVDGVGRAGRYFGAGDSVDPLTAEDNALSELETDHSVGALVGTTTSEVIDKNFKPPGPKTDPVGIYTKTGKALAVSTVVSAIPTKLICDTYDDLKNLGAGGKRGKGKDPKCP
jgi:RHS repeat-associated protein